MVKKGTTYEQNFGKEKSDKLKMKHSILCKINNPMHKENARLKSSKSHLGKKLSPELCKKLSDIRKGKTPKNLNIWIEKGKSTRFFKGQIPYNKGKKMPEEQRLKIKDILKTYIHPKKDTRIEVKMQNFLKQLGITFFTHQYIKEIEHGYQCDILIPIQKGINKKTIIECFGNYWHNYPIGNERDTIRTQELLKNNFRVLVFWENEIKVMHLKNLREALL